MDIWQAVSQFGIPTVLLVAVMFYLQKGGTFVATSVLVPLTLRIIDYTKTQEVCLLRQTVAIEKQADILQALEVTTARIGGTQAEIVKVVNKISDTQDSENKKA